MEFTLNKRRNKLSEAAGLLKIVSHAIILLLLLCGHIVTVAERTSLAQDYNKQILSHELKTGIKFKIMEDAEEIYARQDITMVKRGKSMLPYENDNRKYVLRPIEKKNSTSIEGENSTPNQEEAYVTLPNVKAMIKEVEKIYNTYVNVKNPKPVDVTRFIFNEALLSSVYELKMYGTDQKVFIDTPTIVSIKEYKKNFFDLFNAVQKDKQKRLHKKDLKAFLKKNFADGTALEIKEFKNNQKSLLSKMDNINWNSCKECVENGYEYLYEKLKKSWDKLIRKVDTKCTNTGVNDTCFTTQLEAEDYVFAVPGGRFTELYYWDFLFVEMGLLLSGRNDVVESTLRLFKKWIKEHGHVPNGGRTYYLNRSQPPVFAMMVNLYLKFVTEDDNYISNSNDRIPSDSYDKHKKRLAIIAEFGTALLSERTEYWDKDRYSFVSNCEAKLRNELNNLFVNGDGSNSFISSPFKVLNEFTNIYDPENISQAFIELSCSGYHYGPDLRLSVDGKNYENYASFAADHDFNYENWLEKKMETFLPRVESFGHDFKVAEELISSNGSLGKDNLVHYVRNPELRKKIIMQTFANYAESGWDFSSRWLSIPTAGRGQIEETLVNILSSDDYAPPESEKYNKLNNNSKFLLSNLETANIYPIDLNSILLENNRIITSYLQYFNEYICKDDTFYKKNKIDANKFKVFLKGATITSQDDDMILDTYVINAEILCNNIDFNISKYDSHYKGLRNFIALMLWDPVVNHFGDYNERFAQINQSPSAAEAFAYVLDTGDITRRQNKIEYIASSALQRLYDRFSINPARFNLPIKDIIFKPDLIHNTFRCFDYNNISPIYTNAHLKLAQLYRNLNKLNLSSHNKSRKYFSGKVAQAYLETENDLNDLFSSSNCTISLPNYDNNWIDTPDPTFDGVITINELLQLSGIVYHDHLPLISYKKFSNKHHKFSHNPTVFYDLYSSRISFSSYTSSFLKLIYSLNSYTPDSDIQSRILHPVPATKIQTSLQWDAPNNWAPLEYAATFSILNLIKYKDLSSYSCSIIPNISPLTPLCSSLLLHQYRGPGVSIFLQDSIIPNSYFSSLHNCDNNASSLLYLISHSTFVKRLSNYVKLITSAIDLSPDEDIKFFEKYNVIRKSSGSGGEYAPQIGFGWTNGYLQVALYNIARYYSQSSE